MSERSAIIGQLNKKVAEIQSLEEKIRSARIYVKALQDVLKLIDENEEDNDLENIEHALRKGSLVDRARDLLLKRGSAMHIDDILRELGKDVSRENKASLAGSLAAYVRRGEIFIRPAPNTFGLMETSHQHLDNADGSGLPKNFGGVEDLLDDDVPF